MDFLKTLGRGIYYRIRRIKKALRNWRKFGVIIFGSLFLASNLGVLMPVASVAAVGQLTYLYTDPATLSIEVGKTYQMNYQAYDENWNPVTVTPNWSMNKPAAGSINAAGEFSASTTPGTYTNAIKLNSGALSTYAKVVVYESEPQLTYLYTDPATLSIEVGTSYQMSYKAHDENWDPISITPTWSMNKPVAGSINSTGLFTASTTLGTYTNAIKLNSGVLSAYTKVVVYSSPLTNQPPVANLTVTPNSGNAPLYAVLNASGSFDPDGTIVKYEWDRDGNGSFEYVGSSIISYIYSVAGTYPVQVRVTDDYGNQTTATQIVVVNQVPLINQSPLASLVAVPNSGNAPLPVVLDASGSLDPDGSIVSYDWDRDGNGSFELTTPNPVTTYTYAVGTYLVQVRVTDNLGATALAVQTVIVGGVIVPGPLTVTASVDNPVISTYGSTVFRAQAYRDGSPVVASYEWVIVSGSGSFVNRFVQNATFNANGTTGVTNVRVYASEGGNTATANSSVTIQGVVPPPADYIEVIISPRAQDVYPGNTLTYAARVYNRYGTNVTSSSSVLWSLPNSNAGYIQSQTNYGTYSQVVIQAGSLIGTFPVRAQAWYGLLFDIDEVNMSVRYQYPPTPDYWITASFNGVIEDGSLPGEGDVILYTITLANYQPNTVHNVWLTMAVPDYTTFASASSAVDHPSIFGDTISWQAGDIFNGQIRTLFVRVNIKPNLPINGVAITGYAHITANEIAGFDITSNTILVGGGGTGDTGDGPLAETGIDWKVLVALVLASLGLTILTYTYVSRRPVTSQTFTG